MKEADLRSSMETKVTSANLPRTTSTEVLSRAFRSANKKKLALDLAADRFGCTSKSSPEILSLAYHLGETLDLARRSEKRVNDLAKDVARTRDLVSFATNSIKDLKTNIMSSISNDKHSPDQQSPQSVSAPSSVWE